MSRAASAAFVVWLTAPLSPSGAATTAAEVTPGQWEADLTMRRGDHAYLDGRVRTALGAFRVAAALDPRRVDAHWRIGHCLVKLRRVPEALAALQRARDLAPDDPRVLNTCAVVHMLAGNLLEAVRLARRATQFAPRVADVWDTLGWAAAHAGDRDQARTAFETALRLDPSHRAARRGLARLRR
jgi:Flp pilus assembly protein TadD